MYSIFFLFLPISTMRSQKEFFLWNFKGVFLTPKWRFPLILEFRQKQIFFLQYALVYIKIHLLQRFANSWPTLAILNFRLCIKGVENRKWNTIQSEYNIYFSNKIKRDVRIVRNFTIALPEKFTFVSGSLSDKSYQWKSSGYSRHETVGNIAL